MSMNQPKLDVQNITINIAKDFTDSPGGRYRSDGSHSGEEFLEDLLRPRYDQAKMENKLLVIELDGVFGYPSSFVSGSFGVLSSECKKNGEDLLSRIKFVSSSPTRIDRFQLEIKDPTQREKL